VAIESEFNGSCNTTTIISKRLKGYVELWETPQLGDNSLWVHHHE